jgi:hypothetical protein
MTDTPTGFAEIVVVVDEGELGWNLAMAGADLMIETERPSESNQWSGKHQLFLDWVKGTSGPDAAVGLLLGLRGKVFTLGEILFLDSGGREIVGAGRKPDKWGVVVESFGKDLEAAIAKSRVLTGVF